MVHCSLVQKAPKSPNFTHHSGVRWAHSHKSTLNTISSALPWLFCQGHLWSCNYTASCASTFKNDLEHRVHLATLIILMLIGSTVARLFQVLGEPRKIPKSSSELMLSHCMSLLTEEYIVSVDVDCEQNGNGDWAVILFAGFTCRLLNTNGRNNKNTSIKIPLSFACFCRVLFQPNH